MKRAKRIYLALLAVLLSPMAANAGVITIEGDVQGATGAFPALTPIGTLVRGFIDVDNIPAAAGAADINSINISVGGLCFTTDVSVLGCPFGGTLVAIDSNYSAALTFDSGKVKGTLDATATVGFPIDISFSFRNEFFDIDGGSIATTPTSTSGGSVSGYLLGTYAVSSVPEPGTLALLGLGLVGMAARRRKV